MKKLLIVLMLFLVCGCASKKPHRYNSVEEYTNSTNATAKIDHWESPAYKKRKNENISKAIGGYLVDGIFIALPFIH